METFGVLAEVDAFVAGIGEGEIAARLASGEDKSASEALQQQKRRINKR